VQADVAKPEDIKKLFAETKKAFGKLDVLVNNAGIYNFAPLEAITPEHYHTQFNLNVLGLILTTQEAVKHFGARNSDRPSQFFASAFPSRLKTTTITPFPS
jgi:3-oxoacyl-[acyl-carrier protein] reductase